MFNENEKTILYYALLALQDTLYFDNELNHIEYCYEDFRPDIIELNEITSNIDDMNLIIDKILEKLL